MKIVVILTCFNRKEKTEKCIKDIITKNPEFKIKFVVADDNSNDGTIEMLENNAYIDDIKIIKGNGNMYYSGGMRACMDYLINSKDKDIDYLLMVNDDVEFNDGFLELLINKSIKTNNSIIVGATSDRYGELSYGAIKCKTEKNLKFDKVSIFDKDLECDTFNANCVLLPYSIFLNNNIFDKFYIHSLGDFDYGLSLSKRGYKILTSNEYVGVCINDNKAQNTWNDTNLSIIKRIILKEKPKGAPIKQWFYFLKKNFGIYTAIRYSVSPYIRIILGR